MKDKTFSTLSGLFFLIFFVGVTAVALEQPLRSQFIRAKDAIPHPVKSAVFISPQIGKIGDEGTPVKPQKITVSVFLRDASSQAISGTKVELAVKLEPEAPTNAVTIAPGKSTTDENGLAKFTVTSKKSGKAQFTVMNLEKNTPVDIQSIPTVEFIE